MKNKPKHSSKKNAKLNPDITPMSCLYLKGKGRLKKRQNPKHNLLPSGESG